MQPLQYPPRGNLSDAAVTGLLQSQSAIKISYGAMAYDSNFNPVTDLAAYMVEGSTVSSDITATIHRTCSINIQADVSSVWSYLSGYLKPYMTITDVLTGYSAQFNLGMYTLTTPSTDLSTSPAILNFSGYDLIYLLQQEIGDSYEVASGSDPAAAAATAIGLAIPGVVVNYIPATTNTTSQITFPFDPSQPLTWLDVVNTLTNSIGYRGVWVDWEGVFRIEPFEDAQTVNPEWVFDLTAKNNIVAEPRTQDQDIFDIPNYWRFVMANLTAAPVEGVSQLTYEDNSANNPGSTRNRGRYQKKIVQVTATSFDQMQLYAQRVVQEDLKPSEIFTLTMQPFPLFWHMDVVEYTDPNLSASLPTVAGIKRKALVTQWSIPLDGQSDMSHTWQTVTDSTVLAILNSI